MTAMRQGPAVGGLVGSLAGLAMVTSLGIAQTDEQLLSATRACASIEDDAERLACLDAALGSDESASDAGASEAPASPADASPADASPADDSPRTVLIVEVRRNDFGWTRFVVDSGESFIQRSGARGRYPAVPFEAELRPAMGDSFFLVSPLGGPRVRVTPAD